MDIYSDIIVKHSKNPKNYLGNRGISGKQWQTTVGRFPACSENLILHSHVEDEKFIDLKWTGTGSIIMVASASICTDHVCGMTFEETLAWADKVFEYFSKIKDYKKDELGELVGLEQVKNYPRRVRSAILPVHTIKLTIAKIRAQYGR